MAPSNSNVPSQLLLQLLQFLSEEGYSDALHGLERETGLYFNATWFEELVVAGKWDEAETYLAGFTSIEDNGSSLKMYFEIRKQKYLEALDRKDHIGAIKILKRDLRIFQALNQEIFNELTSLLTLDDFRQNEKLAVYGDTANARALMLQELSSLATANPALRERMVFPQMAMSSLRNLFVQSLQWQSAAGGGGRGSADGLKLANGQFRPRLEGVPSAGASLPAPDARAGIMQFADAARSVPAGSSAGVRPQGQYLGALPHLPSQPKGLGRKRQGNDGVLEPVPPKRGRVESIPLVSSEDLPTHVARVVNLPSHATSCDFHPFLHSLLLAGTVTGQALLWSLPNRDCLLELRCDSKILRPTPINRIVWSPEGNWFGMGFAKHNNRGIIHLYRWTAENTRVADTRLEIDAHENGVNDLALTNLDGALVVVSGGGDCKVKVWSATLGQLMFCFTGHEGPVFSVCPHVKGNISFVFSTGRDGRIKAWLYDSQVAAVVDYSAPGLWWSHMAYSTDGSRLFSCGVGSTLESTLVEWNESDGAISRRYKGFRNTTGTLNRFDTASNRYIIIGDDASVKVWEMDKPDHMMLLPVERAELPATPLVRVNKPANLLAVSTANNTLNILANAAGMQLLGTIKPAQPSRPEASVSAPPPGPQARSSIQQAPLPQPDRPQPETELVTVSEGGKCFKVKEIEGGRPAVQRGVQRLVFASSGTELLGAMHSGATFLWSRLKSVPGAAADTSDVGEWKSSGPRFSASSEYPKSDGNLVRCLAISRNNSYMLSASGGKVSLHNLVTFKEITTFQRPPPAATAVAFHPQDNNVIALGLEDAVVAIYNVRLDVVQHSMKAHEAAVTGLAFVGNGKHLVSGGRDASVCFWSPSNDSGEKFIAERTARLQPAYEGTEPPSAGPPVNVCFRPPPTCRAFPVSCSSSMLECLWDMLAQVQGHTSGDSVLVQHMHQLAIYDVATAVRTAVWSPHSQSAFSEELVVSATFSADSAHVLAAFMEGRLCIFSGTTLQPLQTVTMSVLKDKPDDLRPTALAAQPAAPGTDTKPCRLAVGFSDCSVVLLEPVGTSSWDVNPAAASEAPAASHAAEDAQADPPPAQIARVDDLESQPAAEVQPAEAPQPDGAASEKDGPALAS